MPGLVTEADTLEALSAKLEIMVPELLEANGVLPGTEVPYEEVPYELLARRFAVAYTMQNQVSAYG